MILANFNIEVGAKASVMVLELLLITGFICWSAFLCVIFLNLIKASWMLKTTALTTLIHICYQTGYGWNYTLMLTGLTLIAYPIFKWLLTNPHPSGAIKHQQSHSSLNQNW